MLFSIIVPVYKVEKYLKRCVESLRNQTYEDIEIILVDDGSPDCCPKICDEYATKDNRIKVLHKKNGGLSDARNAGLALASGEYVLFVDSDDWLKNNSCEQFAKYVDNDEKIDICIGRLLNDDGSYYSPASVAEIGKVYRGEDYYTRFYRYIIPCAVAPVYRKNFLIDNDLHFLVGKYHEDNEFTPRAYIMAEKIIYSGIDHYVRFLRNDSITQHNDKRKNLLDLLEISHILLRFANTLPNEFTRIVLKNSICESYLSLFYQADIFQYREEDYGKFIDKTLVIDTAYGRYNKLRGLLFAISPRLYIVVHKIVK